MYAKGSQMGQVSSSVSHWSDAIGRVLDNTALSDYQTCPRKYYFGMVLNRRSNQRSAALNYGTWWHTIMELHYKGFDRETIHAVVLEKYTGQETPDDYRTISRVLMEYDNYTKRYGTCEAESSSGSGTTLGTGVNGLVELPVELDIGTRHPYAGKVDRVFELRQKNYIEDHKTTSQLRSNWAKEWMNSQQMKGYCILGHVLTNKPIAGVRINLHVCRKSGSEFERATLSFSQDILDECRETIDYWQWRIETSAINAREGNIDAAYPPNYNACSGKYSMCQYAEICSLGKRVRSGALEADFPINPWNPLEAHDE